ncbi:MAG: GtrA family protein [Clostridia bacterium]|nr:GtrA family protein [Clostridia bacterium]
MINIIKQQRKKFPKLYEAIRFLIVGGVATIIDMLVMGAVIFLSDRALFANEYLNVFFMKSRASSAVVVSATAIGFVVGLIFNYVFSLLYVYDYDSKEAKTKKGFVLFAILSSIGLALQTVGMYIFYSLLGLNQWIVKIILVFVVLVFNYVTRKLFIFKEKRNRDFAPLVNSDDNISINDKLTVKEKLLNCLFVFSSGCLSLFLYNPETFGVGGKFVKFLPYIYFIMSICIATFLVAIINKKMIGKIKFSIKSKVAIITLIYATVFTFNYMYVKPLNIKNIALAVFSIFAVYCYCYLLINLGIKFVKRFWAECDKLDKKIFIVLSMFGICISIVIALLTRIFMSPALDYDVFFSFDTGMLVAEDYQINQLMPQNDFRHFLMSLAIAPFGIIASIIKINIIKGLIISCIQVLIISYSIVKVRSFLQIKNKALTCAFVVLCVVTSTIMFNVFTAEKFVFALFYIIACIDYSIKKSPYKWVFFVGAISIMTTNIFILPIVLWLDKKPFKEWFAELVVIATIFLSVLILSGQFNLLLFFKNSWDALKIYTTTNISMNFKQYLVFVASILISPKMIFANKISQAMPSTTMAIAGVFVLCVSLLGFILNYKDRYTQVAFYWQCFMFVLLVVIGWGAALNEMFIYSALFLWSTISLIYKFIDRIIKSISVKVHIISAFAGVILIYNIINFINILAFAISKYPTF